MGRYLSEQLEVRRGPWCLSISQFLLSRRESKAAEVMSHRSCAVLSPLKSSFQLVILMRPHNNPGNCQLRDQASCFRWGDESPERSTGSAKVTQHSSGQRQGRWWVAVFLHDEDKLWGIPPAFSLAACCCAEAGCLSSNPVSVTS